MHRSPASAIITPFETNLTINIVYYLINLYNVFLQYKLINNFFYSVLIVISFGHIVSYTL